MVTSSKCCSLLSAVIIPEIDCPFGYVYPDGISASAIALLSISMYARFFFEIPLSTPSISLPTDRLSITSNNGSSSNCFLPTNSFFFSSSKPRTMTSIFSPSNR